MWLFTCASKKEHIIFMIKYLTQLRIKSTQKNQTHEKVGDGHIKKTLWYLRAYNDLTHINVRKIQQLDYYKW